jgi:hypothetical protein
MKKIFFDCLIFFPTIFFFISCGVGKDTTKINSFTFFQLNNYSLKSPPGENWDFSESPDKSGIIFEMGGWEQLGNSYMYGALSDVKYVKILIYRYNISRSMPDEDLTEINITNDFIESELKLARDSYSRTGICDIILDEMDTTYAENRNFIRQYYRLFNCRITDDSDLRNGIGIYQLYFPKRYKSQRIFYLFLIEEYSSRENAKTVPEKIDYVDELYSIIRSFSCNED